MGKIKSLLNDLGDFLENEIDKAGKAMEENDNLKKFKDDLDGFAEDASGSMEKGKGIIKETAKSAVGFLRELADKLEKQLDDEAEIVEEEVSKDTPAKTEEKTGDK